MIIRIEGWLIFDSRIIKKTPAVTRVDEWTNAEIGVGAAMAIGSHAENGNWALLVKLAISNMIIINLLYSIFVFKFQFMFIISILIDNKIIISPMRLVSNVIEPDDAEL